MFMLLERQIIGRAFHLGTKGFKNALLVVWDSPANVILKHVFKFIGICIRDTVKRGGLFAPPTPFMVVRGVISRSGVLRVIAKNATRKNLKCP